jgi:hypothetical protein
MEKRPNVEFRLAYLLLAPTFGITKQSIGSQQSRQVPGCKTAQLARFLSPG